MIGLSLSLCVREVLEGKVAIMDVERIIAGTCAPDPDAFRKLLNEYAETYWGNSPEEGIRIALELYNAGKIYQPRLEKPNHFPNLTNRVYWVESEGKIVWYDSAEQGADWAERYMTGA